MVIAPTCAVVHVGMQKTHYPIIGREKIGSADLPRAVSASLARYELFGATQWQAWRLGWRPVADPGRGQHWGHEWCHLGRQQAALRATVSAQTECFAKMLRFVDVLHHR